MERINEAMDLLKSLIECQASAVNAFAHVKTEMANGESPAVTREKLLAIEKVQTVVQAGIQELADRMA